MSIMRDGARVSSGHLCEAEAPTEPVGEKSNLFETLWGSNNTKETSVWMSLLRYQSARRGSNPRPPPWQGGAPPLSHSRLDAFTRKKYNTLTKYFCQQNRGLKTAILFLQYKH